MHFDIVVLCHSLDADESTAIVEAVHAREKRSPVLQVVKGVVWSTAYESVPVDAIVETRRSDSAVA